MPLLSKRVVAICYPHLSLGYASPMISNSDLSLAEPRSKRARLFQILVLGGIFHLATLAPPAWSQSASPAPAMDAATTAVRLRLAGEGDLKIRGESLDRQALSKAYGARDFKLIWDSRPEAAHTLASVLAETDGHGINPAVFHAAAIASAIADPLADVTDRDLLVTDGFLRYASAMGAGRADPKSLDPDWALPAPVIDPQAMLVAAITGQDIAGALAAIPPKAPEYQRLRDALKRYRALQEAGGWNKIVADATLKKGDGGEVIRQLRQRLAAEGYSLASTDSDQFDDDLDKAIRVFQSRNGIVLDGQVGKGTLAALNVSAADRVAQIRVNLERWRGTPRELPARRIVVNVPSASLVAYDNDLPALTMRVVVGAKDHPTPAFRGRISSVLYNPPWNVPYSIAQKEIYPKVRADPNYLAKNHYILRDRADDPYGKEVDWRRSGASSIGRVQQLPGPDNALGQVKFEIFNSFDVYLHDTPSRFFGRAIRALSHGCVRVEHPKDLALFVLGGQTGGTVEDIAQGIASGETKRVGLAKPVAVYLFYWTTFVDEDGTIEFREDLYGRDRKLLTVMDRRPRRDQA